MDEALKRRLAQRDGAQPIPAAQLVERLLDHTYARLEVLNSRGAIGDVLSHQSVRLESRLQTVRDTSAPKKS
jgi:hypothetical protein